MSSHSRTFILGARISLILYGEEKKKVGSLEIYLLKLPLDGGFR